MPVTAPVRTVILKVRVTPTERDLLTRAARKDDLPMSSFVRRNALAAARALVGGKAK